MSQQALVPIKPGDDADADIIMGNFNYLDEKVTENARNITTSVATINNTIYSTLSVYQDINILPTSGELEPGLNTVNSTTPTDEIAITLPEVRDNTKFWQILIQINLTDTDFITADDNKLGTNYFFNGYKPIFPSTGNYDIIYAYDSIKNKWCCGVVFKGVV